ncbi:MAG TPA: Wzz/FepE/Etk N-terminal domain-containing protein [Thermoanaerobaculia bacterium]|nr:Wzz/FepE/Etk N-terminal domain-containing protein [Thermoanaerobaculia bacterium]
MSSVQPSPRPVSGVRERDEIPSLVDVVRFLGRQRWLILGCALAAAVAAFVYFRFLVPPRYEATATLVVVPPRIPDNLRPQELSVQGYERLLRSDAVLAETRRRLVQADVLAPGRDLEVGEELAVRLTVAPRTEAPLAPTLEAVAFSSDPARAAAIANTWSAAFLELSGGFLDDSLVASNRFLVAELEEARAKLVALEQQKIEAADEAAQARGELEARWEQRLEAAGAAGEAALGAARREHQAAVAEYDRASQRALEAVPAEGPLPSGALGAMVRQVASLRARLAQNPGVAVLESTDPAHAPGPGGRWSPRAVTWGEELDPLHAELTLRLAEVQAGAEALAATAPEAERQRVHAMLAELERIERERAAGRRELHQERVLALERLRRRSELDLQRLGRQRERELAALDRRHQAAEAILERELVPARQLHDQLGRSVGEAELAEGARELPDVRLGSAAAPPVEGQPRRAGFRAVVALVLGGLAGVVLAMLRDLGAARWPRGEEAAASPSTREESAA